jgi:sugar/nucleoside kinase (ribokinase family)
MIQDIPEKKLPVENLSELSILVVGTTCCDMTNPEFDFLDDISGDGLVVDSTRMVPLRPDWLDSKKDSYAMGGGSLNIAPLVSQAGIPAGILTSLGIEQKQYDIHGRFMLEIMKKTGTKALIIPNQTRSSGASFIRPAQPHRREAILHTPNALDDLDLETEEILDIMTHLDKDAIIHYVYSGSLKTMDSEEGKKLGRVMKKLNNQGYITMVDPHTLSKNPQESIRTGEIIKGYNRLKPVLPHLSWFFASEVEAMMIAHTFGFFLKNKSQKDKNNAFLHQIADIFCTDNSPRIIGITAGTVVTIMYLSPEGKRVGPLPVKSRYAIADADQFVGAGDSFRSGFEAEWIRGRHYREKFRAGQIVEEDLERLCHAGHLMAACYVTRTPLNQYGNIPTYNEMAKVIDSGGEFSDKGTLLSALNIQE